MKRFLLVFMAVCLVVPAAARSRKCYYRVTVAEPRKECPVVIDDVPAWANGAEVRTAAGELIPSQFDGPLRELVFVADIEKFATFEVRFLTTPDLACEPRVNAQMWWKNEDKTLREADTLASTADDMYHKLHHHGPAFESEKAAYRIYFDKKQTIDTYGKKRPRLELRETMWYPSDEQLEAGYGHDNLRVFGTVGVGALKPWDAKKRKMVHITDFARREARIIARGPLRTVVEMEVEGWRYCGRTLNMTSRYILYAGHADVEVENRIEGDVEGLVFATGVMKMAEHDVVRDGGVTALFGSDYPERDTVKWEREAVGLAIAVEQEQIAEVTEDKGNYLYLLKADTEGCIDYSFEMLWRKSEWLSGHSDAELLQLMPREVRLSRVKAVVEPLRGGKQRTGRLF